MNSPRYERRDWQLRPFFTGIVTTVLGLAAALIAAAGVFWFYGFLNPRNAEPAAREAARASAAPMLQADPRGDLADYRRRQLERLNGYAWSDKGAGKVGIPIDLAMEQAVRRGFPLWPTSTTTLMRDAVTSR